jgi:hypothetical protein
VPGRHCRRVTEMLREALSLDQMRLLKVIARLVIVDGFVADGAPTCNPGHSTADDALDDGGHDESD